MRVKKSYGFILFFLFMIFSWLFLGIYEEPEWSEKRIFLKHKASINWYFPNPQSEFYTYVESLDDLPINFTDKETMLYIEFINEGKAYDRSIFFVPSIWFPNLF